MLPASWQLTWVVPVTTSPVTTVFATGVRTPTIIRNNFVLHWAGYNNQAHAKWSIPIKCFNFMLIDNYLLHNVYNMPDDVYLSQSIYFMLTYPYLLQNVYIMLTYPIFSNHVYIMSTYPYLSNNVYIMPTYPYLSNIVYIKPTDMHLL